MAEPEKHEKCCFNCVHFRSYRDLYFDNKETNLLGICLNDKNTKNINEADDILRCFLCKNHLIIFQEVEAHMLCDYFEPLYKNPELYALRF